MKTNKSSLVLLAVALAFAFCVEAASDRGWLGGMGDWSDNSKWDHPTYGPINNRVNFLNGGTVNLDGAYTNYDFTVRSAVRFCGEGIAKGGPAKFTDADITVSDSATLAVHADNPAESRVEATDVSITVEDNAKVVMMNLLEGVTNLVVRGNGCFEQYGSNGTKIHAGGAMTVSGGTYSSIYPLALLSGARYTQSGGSVTAKSMSVVDGEFAQTGGTLNVETLTVSGSFLLNGGTLNASSVSLATGTKLALANAWLKLPVAQSPAQLEFPDLVVGENAGVEFVMPSGVTAGRYVIFTTAIGRSLDALSVKLSGACEGWAIHKVANYVVLMSDYDPSAAVANPYTWIGGVDTKWSTDDNWKFEGAAPVAGTNVFVLGHAGPVVENDIEDGRYYQIRNLNDETLGSAIPVLIRGRAIELTSTASRNANAAVYSLSRYPIFFECPVFSTGTSLNPYAATKDGTPGVCFFGGVIAKALQIQGKLYVGGMSACGSISYSTDTQGNNKGHTTVVPGGVFSITNQKAVIDHGITVMENAKLIVKGTTFAWKHSLAEDSKQFDHTINGELTVEAPYASFPVDQEFQGSGKVWLPAVAAEQTGTSQKMVLSDSLTVYLKGFTTAHGGELYRAIEVKEGGAVTLGAEQDWTYGPDGATAGTRTSSAADRALTIPEGASLTVDTADPKTGEGHAVTFVDPVSGAGTLRKTGAGTLALATGSAETSLELAGGTFYLLSAQGYATVNVAAETELAFSKEVAETIVPGRWTTVLMAGSIAGVEKLTTTGFKFRVVEDGDGTLLQASRKGGLMLIFR